MKLLDWKENNKINTCNDTFFLVAGLMSFLAPFEIAETFICGMMVEVVACSNFWQFLTHMWVITMQAVYKLSQSVGFPEHDLHVIINV